MAIKRRYGCHDQVERSAQRGAYSVRLSLPAVLSEYHYILEGAVTKHKISATLDISKTMRHPDGNTMKNNGQKNYCMNIF